MLLLKRNNWFHSHANNDCFCYRYLGSSLSKNINGYYVHINHKCNICKIVYLLPFNIHQNNVPKSIDLKTYKQLKIKAVKYQYLEGYNPIFYKICLNYIYYCIKYIIRPHFIQCVVKDNI